MALLEGSTGIPILRPEQVAALVTIPWQAASFALAATTLIQAQSPTVRIPVIATDLTCGFVDENEQITPTDPDIDELPCVPRKLVCITRISRELAMDSTPEVQGVVGSSISRTLARATDANFFAASTVNGDPGLYSLLARYGPTTATGFPAQEVVGYGGILNLDPFLEAQSLLEVHGAKLNHYFADARTVLALSLLKTFTDTDLTSNVPLLHAEAEGAVDSNVSGPLVRMINGVPVHALPASAGINVGDIWGIDGTRVFGVIREGVTLATSSDLWFD